MYKIKLFLLICSSILLFSVQNNWAADTWPLGFARNGDYGESCTACTNVYSQQYCAGTCCASCTSGVREKNLNPSLCAQICTGNPSISSPVKNNSDIKLDQDCEEEGYQSQKCLELKAFNDEELNIRFERRKISCDEAVVLTRNGCAINELNKAYPKEVFSLSKQVVDAPSCDFSKIDDFNIKSDGLSPDSISRNCENSFNECKKYCFDENVVTKDDHGRVISRTYDDGQRKFESYCKPSFEDFTDQKDLRDQMISQANDRVLSCQASAPAPNDDPELNDPPSVKDPDPKKAINNPEVVSNNLGQLMSSLQPFMPTATSNYHPGLYNSEVGRSGGDSSYSSSLSDSELYGSGYYNPDDVDDFDYTDDPGGLIDKPNGLKATANPQNQQNRTGGNNFGALGGSSASNSNPTRTDSSGRRRSALPKDKTLFGKQISSSNTYKNYDNNSSLVTSRLRPKGTLTANGDPKKVFDASKYHNMIMASYQKGYSSKAQRLAMRRAAGLNTNSYEERRSDGYTQWHLDYKIHPEKISLFTQTRLCYYRKFRSNFTESCEFKRPLD